MSIKDSKSLKSDAYAMSHSHPILPMHSTKHHAHDESSCPVSPVCTPTCSDTSVPTGRYYIDGEQNASIAMHPAMAAGTGFDDATAPWGTKWIGLGAGKGAWVWM